jgi:undecaprenyl-diphosphatase
VTRRRPAALAVGATLALTAWLASQRTPWDLERAIGQWVYDLPDVLTPVFKVVMQAGAVLAPLLVALVLVVVGRYRPGLAVALAGFGAWVGGKVAKELIERPRPTAEELGRVPREVLDGLGYPSGHAAVSAALAAVLVSTVVRGRGARAVVVGVAVLTAVARVHLGVHWALDVVGGAALGVLVALLALAGARLRTRGPEGVRS